MPLDHPRPAVLSGKGSSCGFGLDAELTSKFKRTVGSVAGCTPFMGMLAAWQVLLCRYSRSSEVVVGVPYHGRAHPDLHRLIGYFVNPLAMRVSVASEEDGERGNDDDAGAADASQARSKSKGGLTFRQLLARVRGVAGEAFGHADVGFHEVVQAVRERERQLKEEAETH